MRVLIVEEVLGSFQSHHYAYQSAIATGAQELRVNLDLLINIKAAGLELNFPMAGRNPPRAALRTMSALSMGGEDGIANRPKRFFVLAWNVWANVLAVRRVLRKEPRYDVILCPTTWMPHVVMFLLLSLLEGKRLGNLCLLFVRYPKIGERQPRAFRAIKRWINLLCAVHPRTRILAETKYAQRSWGELLGRPVGYVVHPVEAAQPPRTDCGEQRTGEKSGEFVHKSSGGEGSGSTSPIGESSCAGAKPELPVCKQGRGGGHDLTTNHSKLHERGEKRGAGSGELVEGSFEPPITLIDNDKDKEAGQRLASQAGAAFSNPFTSELARDSENTSLTRSACAPASLPATSYPPLATSASPVVFGFYGFARHEQGVDVLMRALEILKDKGELDAEFRIVWPKAFQMPDGSWMDREMFGHLGANARFFENPLSPEDYLRELSETDWLILPYRVGSYEGRCSRISIEACVMAIPVIYTKGTDLEEVVRSHGEGIGVPEEDADALANAIRLALQENRAIKEKAVAKQAGAQANFSGMHFLKEFFSYIKFNS
jgi:glycosyltransferase involved in cell wall biosynthesis